MPITQQKMLKIIYLTGEVNVDNQRNGSSKQTKQ